MKHEYGSHHNPFNDNPLVTSRLSYRFFRVSHALGGHFRALAHEHGFNRTKGAVMGMLSHAEDGLTASALRQRIGVTAASMSNALNEMERDGWVRRTPHPDDARAMLIHLTERGRDTMQAFPGVFENIEARAFAGFSQDELAALRSMLERILVNLEDDGGCDEGVPETMTTTPIRKEG